MRTVKGLKFALVAFAALLVNTVSSGAFASLDPHWVTPTKITKEVTNPDGSKTNAVVADPDINKDGKGDYLAITNLVDIAFNDKGEILGWYPKMVKGTDNKDNYDRQQTIVMKDALSSVVLSANGKQLGAAVVTPPKLEIDGEPNARILTATFQYTAGGSSVTKIYTINASKLTLDLDLSVTGLSNYQIEFVGLGGGKPVMKALESGQTTPLEVGETASRGEVKNAVYASMQCCRSFLAAKANRLSLKIKTRTAPCP